MKTVSSKLSKEEHKKFLELCNKEGQTVSEKLRGMIQDCCNITTDDGFEKITPEPKITVTDVD